jgi:hypothetical protein
MNYAEATALLEGAIGFETRGQYERAAEEFFIAASGLHAAAQGETEPKIQQLLQVKATQVEGWAQNLFVWIAHGKHGQPPTRF